MANRIQVFRHRWCVQVRGVGETKKKENWEVSCGKVSDEAVQERPCSNLEAICVALVAQADGLKVPKLDQGTLVIAAV